MSTEPQIVAIAKACGWTDVNFYEDNAGPGYWNGFPPVQVGADEKGEWTAVKAKHHKRLPDYLNSLDAMHEAEKLFDGRDTDTRSLWLDNLALVVGWPETQNAAELKFEIQYLTTRATAPQRAEAFLRTLNLWTEQPPTP